MAKRKPVRRTRSAKRVKRDRDAALSESAVLVPRRNRPKPPPRLDTLSQPQQVRMVKKLIPKPDPVPPPAVQKSVQALQPPLKRFHGMRVPLHWYPGKLLRSPCADKFGYMFKASVRQASKLPFDATHQNLLNDLGNLIGDPARDTGADSTIPAGYTYFGQFVDHDITLDVSSSIDAAQNAEDITNMRTPTLDLDSVYGRGPALEPYLYKFPNPLEAPPLIPPTAVELMLGRNVPIGSGGPLNGTGMAVTPFDWDVPRVLKGTNQVVSHPLSSFTAVIGDPRNDENVIVSQVHHAMLRFHNRVVKMLVTAAFPGDIFTEARRIVRHHYQWCVVHDFLKRICGTPAVDAALANVAAAIDSPFRMPVEFSVAAYRFGHSMVRNGYTLNAFLPSSASTLKGIFDFIRTPLLPLFSNWVVDFNMFFNTAHPGGVFNFARKIDSVLAAGLEAIPGGSGVMAVLAARNLRRGLALGLPSGQAAATALGIAPMSTAQLTAGLPPAEIALLNSNGGVLLAKTPLWYYVLREAAELKGGNELGPLGGRIVAETFVRMLKRDGNSFLNAPFTPSLPSSTPGTFTIADMLEFAGVLVQD